MSDRQQIGTVEILETRVYPLDPSVRHGEEVVVDPGTYPVFIEDGLRYWEMIGLINERIEKLEELSDETTGTFIMHPHDVPGKTRVTFRSPAFNEKQFKTFLADQICTEGHYEQRLRFNLFEEVTA